MIRFSAQGAYLFIHRFFFDLRFHRLQGEYEREGRLSPEGARKGRLISKPNTVKAEAWLKGMYNDIILT